MRGPRWLLPAVASCALPHLVPRAAATVVFTSFHGHGYRGNPRILFEHLLCEGRRCARPLDAVWLSTEAGVVEAVRSRFGRARAELAHSTAGVLALSRSRAIVLSHGITDLPFLHLPRRAVVLQSWHGLPTKRGELLRERVPAHERLRVWRDWAPVTHFLSSSSLVTEINAARFGLPRSAFLELGYPMYDALCRRAGPRLDTRVLFPEAPAHERVVLYAPTFRRRETTRFFPFPDLDVSRLKELLDEERALVCLRPHPNDRIDLDRARALSPRIVVADDRRFEDVAGLVLCADAIVTDYSSVYLEGLLADVPCLFVPYDRERYERDLAWDYDRYTPGPKVSTLGGFAAALRRSFGNRAADADERRRVRDAFFSTTDGGATERVASWIEAVVGAGS